MNLGLQGKLAVVTGSTADIGLAGVPANTAVMRPCQVGARQAVPA